MRGGGRDKTWVYEEYANAAEKRRAQRGATPRKPTGKARGYVFLDPPEKGFEGEGLFGWGNIQEEEPGNTSLNGLVSTGLSWKHLRECCRRVAVCYLPPSIKRFYDWLEDGQSDTPRPTD